jgi:hypothetical protein
MVSRVTCIFVTCFSIGMLVTGCGAPQKHSNNEIDKALSLYRACIDSGKTATHCDRYWEQRNQAINRSLSNSGCDKSIKVDVALSLYRQCIDSGKTATHCDRYWEQRNAALVDDSCEITAKKAHTESNSSPNGNGVNALIMGVLCSMSGNSAACMKGASNSLTPKRSDSIEVQERVKEVEDRAKSLEQRLRNQCALRGGFYNPVTGCNK